jgi:anion-transporting  ArsA/GET3 family ATPase
MTYSIALAGKGGTGKTTVCGLIVDHLVKAGKGLILAVDADANSNLNDVLGSFGLFLSAFVNVGIIKLPHGVYNSFFYCIC